VRVWYFFDCYAWN